MKHSVSYTHNTSSPLKSNRLIYYEIIIRSAITICSTWLYRILFIHMSFVYIKLPLGCYSNNKVDIISHNYLDEEVVEIESGNVGYPSVAARTRSAISDTSISVRLAIFSVRTSRAFLYTI